MDIVKIAQPFLQGLMIPVPPGNPLDGVLDIVGKTKAQLLLRHSGNNGIGRDVMGNHGASSYHCAIADANAAHDGRSMTNPDIMADTDLTTAPSCKEFFIIMFSETILQPAIETVVLTDPFHGMIARVDADIGGNVDKFADIAVGYGTALHHIGIITETGFNQFGIIAYFGIPAKG